MKHILRPAYFFTVLILAFASPVWADDYTVEDITVDVSAANAVQAREKAFEEAQVKGYKMLAERFLTPEELENFEAPDIHKISSLIKDFEVTHEKLSATRYAGTYKIRYSSRSFSNKPKPEEQNETTFSESEKSKQSVSSRGHILVFPFLKDGAGMSLWRVNPLRQAWLKARDNGRSIPAIVPVGDTTDISSIRDNQALSYDPQAIGKLVNRYRATQAAIVIVTPELLPDGSENIALAIYRHTPYGPELFHQMPVRSVVGESREDQYDRLVAQTVAILKAPSWSKALLAQRQATAPPSVGKSFAGPTSSMIAQISYGSMREWVDAKKALERTPGVRGVMIKSLSPKIATLSVSYQGSVDTLRKNLLMNGVSMNDPLTQRGSFTAEDIAIYQLHYR